MEAILWAQLLHSIKFHLLDFSFQHVINFNFSTQFLATFNVFNLPCFMSMTIYFDRLYFMWNISKNKFYTQSAFGIMPVFIGIAVWDRCFISTPQQTNIFCTNPILLQGIFQQNFLNDFIYHATPLYFQGSHEMFTEKFKYTRRYKTMPVLAKPEILFCSKY